MVFSIEASPLLPTVGWLADFTDGPDPMRKDSNAD